MGGYMITTEEKQFVLQHRNKKEFAEAYIKKFGIPSKLNRVDNLWGRREEFRQELGKVNIAPISKVSTGIAQKDHEPLPDIGEQIITISNKVSELIQIQKDMLALFKKLDKPDKPEVKKDDQTSSHSNG